MARKVLLADDSIAVQRAVEATLEPKDFEVLSVSRGAEVVLEAKKLHPDVILLDGDLSDVDGYEVCRMVKEDPDLMSVPVIIMCSEEDSERARAAGAEAQLPKPFQGNDLLQQVLAVVDMTMESTFKLDTSEMEVLEPEEEASQEEFDLGELELDDSILELTEELDEPLASLADTSEGVLEGLEELDLESTAQEPTAGRRSIKTEELEEISFEEEIDELDLGELELEGAEGLASIEEDVELGSGKEDLLATDEVELGVDFDEEFPLEKGAMAEEQSLLGTEEEAAGLILDTQEGLKEEAVSESIIDTDELEALALEEEEQLLSADGDVLAPQVLEETTIEFNETEELGETELEGVDKIKASGMIETLEEPPGEALEETSLDWEETEISLEPPQDSSMEDEETLEAHAALPGEDTEVRTPSLESLQAPKKVWEEPLELKPAMFQEQTPGRAEAVLEPLEEVGLDEELAVLSAVQEATEAKSFEILEVPLAQLPPLAQGLRLELMEEDFGLVDPFSEEGIRRELAKNLQDMVERILSQMAPPIVEKVARAVALEQAERIVLEEIEKIKQSSHRP